MSTFWIRICVIVCSIATFQAQASVCDRTRVMVMSLEQLLNKNCANISVGDLAEIENFKFEASGITGVLQAADFVGMTNLKNLVLEWPEMTSVPEDLFKAVGTIERIEFSWCDSLTTLPANLFRAVPHLKHLQLYHNSSLTHLPSGLLESNSDLESIYVSSNVDDNFRPVPSILILPKDLFHNKPSLKSVLFLNTGLSEIAEDAFSGSTNLVRLSLRQNSFKSVPANLCRNCTSLQEIQLQMSGIKSIDLNAFVDIPNLKTVYLYQNSLSVSEENNLKAKYPNVNFVFKFQPN